jgi:alpha-glucosidase
VKDKVHHKTQDSSPDFKSGESLYTPAHFRERRRETSWAHQMATAVVFNSPLMFDSVPGQNIPIDPGVEMVKSIPRDWDQTIVLPVSEIGEIAAFARCKNKVWFVAILNGEQVRTVNIPLSFLGAGKYESWLVCDVLEQADDLKLQNTLFGKRDVLSVEMRAGGGFIGRFTKI